LADKLSDFEDEDRYNEGCDTIPNTSNYSSDRSACSTQQQQLTIRDNAMKICKDARP
jgi:hypothetical protein